MFSVLKGIGYAKFRWVFAFWPKWLFDCCFLENPEKHSQNCGLFEKIIFVYTFLQVIVSIERSDVIIKLNCKAGNKIKIIDNCAETYENFL